MPRKQGSKNLMTLASRQSFLTALSEVQLDTSGLVASIVSDFENPDIPDEKKLAAKLKLLEFVCPKPKPEDLDGDSSTKITLGEKVFVNVEGPANAEIVKEKEDVASA